MRDRRDYIRNWAAKNRDKRNAAQRKYVSLHPKRAKSATAEWRKRNPRKIRETNRRIKLAKRYGITLEKLDQFAKDQRGKCAICKGAPSNSRGFHVDHCHMSGKVRGLLCHGCNVAIGLLKERPEACYSAAEYLIKHSASNA